MTNLLFGRLVGFEQSRFGCCGYSGFEDRVGRRGLPVPGWLASLRLELVDRVDRDLLLFVTEDHSTEHDFFRQIVRFGFDHQHRIGRAGDDEIELGSLQLGVGWIQNILTIDVTDARGTDWPLERHARQGESRGSTDHRRDIRVDVRVDRHDRGNDLNLVQESFREQRTDRTIDQMRGERLLFGWTAFTLEEAAGDATRGISLLDVVYGQRKEVLVGIGLLAGNRGDENDGVAHRDEHGAVGLTRQLPRFDRDLMLAVTE